MQYVVTVSTGTLMAKAICDASNHVIPDDLESSLKVVSSTCISEDASVSENTTLYAAYKLIEQ